MAFTAISFTNNTKMVSADLRTNLSRARAWLNGGMVAGDISAGTLQTRNFRKLDHKNINVASSQSALSARVQSSIGPSGGYYKYSVGSDPMDRAYLTTDAQGGGDYVVVPTLGIYFRPDDDGYLDIETEFWAWAVQSDQTVVENLKQADFRIAVEGTTYAPTQRALYDCGTDTGTWQAGAYQYPARNFAMEHAITVTAGTWYSVAVQAKITAKATRANDALIIIGARNMLLTYDRK